MPELPDIAAYFTALEPPVMGLPLEGVRLASPFLLRTTTPALSEGAGRTVRQLRRVGKRIAIGLDGGLWPLLHLMIAGRLHWKPAHAVLSGRRNLAAFDFPPGSLTLTEAGSKRRASLHVVAGEPGLLAMDPGGIDVLTADLACFRASLIRENRTLKQALTDPRIVSGVGNAYSDEILHAARLSAATRGTLELWLKRLSAEARARFPEKVTAFREGMAIHRRYGEPCRRCGAKILRTRYAHNETNHCASCQTGGRVLADRGLSRLLGAGWPRTLDELEELRRH
jgi:formamidopyrimidine-DNA glycosylase